MDIISSLAADALGGFLSGGVFGTIEGAKRHKGGYMNTDVDRVIADKAAMDPAMNTDIPSEQNTSDTPFADTENILDNGGEGGIIEDEAGDQPITYKGGTGVRGKLTGKLDGLTSDERTVVNELLDAGNDLEIIPRSNVQYDKTPDFYVNGVKTELKTLNGSSLNTPVTRIQEGFDQGGKTVILDARKTGMTLEQAEHVIKRIMGIYKNTMPGTVEIWTKEGIIRR